jgi:hypothetical protein
LFERYLFSTFEDDSLLCLLDDTAYSRDESKVTVIPEKFDVEVKEEVFESMNNLKF